MDRHEQDTEDQERSRHGTGDRLIDAMAAVPRGGSGAQEEDPLAATIAEIRDRLAKITPGPWRVDPSYDIPALIARCYPKGATCVDAVLLTERIDNDRPAPETETP
jgi:hypothetical protein